MNIGTIKQLDVGTSNIACRGVIKYLGEPKHITGSKDGRDYDFWTQFVVLEEGKDSIGVNLALESKVALSKNQTIQVEKGTLESYPKDGETKLSLKAKLYSVGNTQQAPSQPPQATNSGQGQSGGANPKNAPFALSYVKDLIIAKEVKWVDFWPTVESFQTYMDTGKTPMVKDDEPQTNDDYYADEPPVDDSEIPF